eukprot:scaffold45428_cov176-Amphora_coffeaeformis.AAC.5
MKSKRSVTISNDIRFGYSVVPCCVFWTHRPWRRTKMGKQVKTWEQFCAYLMAKDDERIQVATLPFPGRNIVIYSLGKSEKKPQ